MELSDNELEVLARLREVMAHGWGGVEVKVQDGVIRTIDQHKQFRPNQKSQLKPSEAISG